PEDSPRILYSVDVYDARYVVVDRFALNWIKPYINQDLVEEIEGNWVLAKYYGEYKIYLNPRMVNVN
ncbi:MAG: hypothetical protein DRO04_02725, partial [Candidatus Iainarchaeum archaeon]